VIGMTALHRPPEKEALPELHAQVVQRAKLVLTLDALGDEL